MEKYRHIYFAGIGGIGMSALAGLLREHGHFISGSDSNKTQKSIQLLRKIGCTIVSEEPQQLQKLSPDLLVYTSAIKKNSPLLLEAARRNIPIWHRSELLAELSKKHRTIAVTGAHGKTTTTSFISQIFLHAKQDPSCIIGGFMQSSNSNYHAGTGPILIAEADESDRSMLTLFPHIIVITNIDHEHLDTYSGPEDMCAAFAQFIEKLPKNGSAVIFADNHYTKQLIENSSAKHRKKILTYGRSSSADFCIIQETSTTTGSSITLKRPDQTRITFSIPQTGSHSIENATAAYAVAKICNIPDIVITQATRSFAGVEQRFTSRGFFHGAELIDDYAHHPTEIAHALTAARLKNPKRLIAIFQPQRYSRTKGLWKEFVAILSSDQIDQLFITDIYSASEVNHDPTINAENLVTAINTHIKQQKAHYITQDMDFSTIRKKIEIEAHSGDIILFLGAGKVNQVAQILAEQEGAKMTHL